MNWAQENKKLAGIVGVMAAGGLGLGFWLYLSWSGYSGAMGEWNQTQGQIKTIRGKKLAPTPDNVALREKQLADYAEKVNQLRGALLAVQQGVKPMSETDFQAKLKDRATEVKRMAKAVTMKELPDDFALGFEKYASQPPRSGDVAAELNIHLDAIEKLVTTCIEAGVASIDVLERTRLPNEDVPAPPKATPGKAKAPPKATTTSKAKKPIITEQSAAEPVLDRYPIKLVITTDQGPLQTVINTLCHPGKMPFFLVVRQVRIQNAKLEGPTKDEVIAKKNISLNAAPDALAPPIVKSPTEAPKPGAPQLITPPKPAAADAFDIMGREMLQVYMEVDYVRFRPPLQIEGEDASPAAPATPAAASAPAK